MLEIVALLLGVEHLAGVQPEVGVAIYYSYADYGERPLYCSTPDLPLYYDKATAAKWPWIAVDVDKYLSGEIGCYTPVQVEFEDGTVRVLYALDAGPLGDYYIEDYPDLPILVDVPEWFWVGEGMSQVVEVWY